MLSVTLYNMYGLVMQSYCEIYCIFQQLSVVSLTEFIALIDESEEVKTKIKQSPSYFNIADYLEKLPLHTQSKISLVMFSGSHIRTSGRDQCGCIYNLYTIKLQIS